MPFKSKAQEKWMWANDPVMAKKWEAHTPKSRKAKMPERVSGKAQPKGVLSHITGGK